MAQVNDMSALINKIERRLGLIMITPHLPEGMRKEEWAKVIKDDTMLTFSRYFPRKIRFVVNDETCVKKMVANRLEYTIKDEYLQGQKLLGAIDIDWQDTTSDNMSIAQTAGFGGGYGYYTPNYGGLENTLETYMNYQMAADISSLYNNNIFVDFEYPNKIILSLAGGVTLSLPTFVVQLLVVHSDLSTISPTLMDTFDDLAQADVARFLWMNLRYFDNLETIYVNIDLKLNELEQEASKREQVLDTLKNSYVSASNDAIPYILTVSG